MNAITLPQSLTRTRFDRSVRLAVARFLHGVANRMIEPMTSETFDPEVSLFVDRLLVLEEQLRELR